MVVASLFLGSTREEASSSSSSFVPLTHKVGESPLTHIFFFHCVSGSQILLRARNHPSLARGVNPSLPCLAGSAYVGCIRNLLFAGRSASSFAVSCVPLFFFQRAAERLV